MSLTGSARLFRGERGPTEARIDGLLLLNNLLYFGPLCVKAGLTVGPLGPELRGALIRGGIFTIVGSATR